MLKILFVSLFCVLLNACSSSPRSAGVVYHQSFDFSQVKNYSLYHRNSRFTSSQNLIDIRRNAIEIAIERTMAKQAFNYIEPAQADVIVTYFLVNDMTKEYEQYNDVVRFCVQCLRANAWQTTKQYSAITKGSLVLDLVDPKKKRSVWRSTYPLNIEVKDNSAELNKKIQQAVTLMLAQYPQLNKQAN